MIFYYTIQIVIVKIQDKYSQYSHSFIYDHLEDQHNRGMLPLVVLHTETRLPD